MREIMNLKNHSFQYLKKILFNPRDRFWFLASHGFYRKVSDKKYLSKAFRMEFNEEMDWVNPSSFNQKIQWLKINDRKTIYTKMVDKYEVKQYISKIIGREYVIPTIGVWDNFEEIDFDTLPDSFVLKCTHDSGGLVICKNKSTLNLSSAKKKIEKSLKNNYYWLLREWPYKDVKPRIIAEQFMQNNDGSGLLDYKFFCFNGEPKFIYISQGLDNHSTARISFVSMSWQFEKFWRSDYQPFDSLPQKPEMFDEMIGIAKKLSKDFCFIRVDLYEIDGKIYFSELTFSPCGGLLPFEPKEFDEKIGNLISLEEIKR